MRDVMAKRVAQRYLKQVQATALAKTAGMRKQAGEVRFIKDRGSDKNEWGWGTPGPSERVMSEEFEYNPKNIKPLASVLRAALMAMGHSLSAYNDFTKIKSAQVSPDGNLGGKGYIQKISEMRRQMMNVIEALSSFTDTIHDEIKAPHWNPAIKEQSARERDDVKNIMNDVEQIRTDPEGFAAKEESAMDDSGNVSEESGGDIGSAPKESRLKMASKRPLSSRVAQRYLLQERT